LVAVMAVLAWHVAEGIRGGPAVPPLPRARKDSGFDIARDWARPASGGRPRAGRLHGRSVGRGSVLPVSGATARLGPGQKPGGRLRYGRPCASSRSTRAGRAPGKQERISKKPQESRRAGPERTKGGRGDSPGITRGGTDGRWGHGAGTGVITPVAFTALAADQPEEGRMGQGPWATPELGRELGEQAVPCWSRWAAEHRHLRPDTQPSRCFCGAPSPDTGPLRTGRA